jgi:signal peptidase II
MILKYLTKNFYINLIFVVSIFLIDRASKLYVIYLDKKTIFPELFSSKFLNISLIWNEGIAFGLFSFEKDYLYNILTIVISLVIIVIFFIIIKNSGFKKYSMLMIFGGAIGNIYDRIFYKAVPDFIDFHVGNFHWFIFNVSDIFITIGVIFVIIIEIIDKPSDETNEKN